ncbi:hypothetical protein TRFO_17475 [Tritrichomonas foetus]|uniref:Uncharacterized protein n=1 Tax=Tritrichomonas foetus TaxID=1144522 RepID=A0A1J4KNE9_9EUKA|nr:hypothetical protein TRFO_17475 [Tritrichomonas foetus]|eukprot:OHT12650.1 hypothetical protein TRFO_17475 [Tritrichomonas foetus]
MHDEVFHQNEKCNLAKDCSINGSSDTTDSDDKDSKSLGHFRVIYSLKGGGEGSIDSLLLHNLPNDLCMLKLC